QIPGTGPVRIINSTTCAMDVRYDFLNTACTSVCLGSIGVVSMAGPSTINFTPPTIAAPCTSAGACDVIVTVLGPTGANWTSGQIIFSTTTPYTANLQDCNGSLYTYTFGASVSSGILNITIQ